MRVCDFARTIGVSVSVAASEIQSMFQLDSAPHSNSSIPEGQLSELTKKYPVLAEADKADSPQPGESVPEAAADLAPTAPAPAPAPVPVPVPQEQPQPVRPSSPTNVVPQSAAPQDNSDPEARRTVTDEAVRRQFEHKEDPPGIDRQSWRVEYPGKDPIVVQARDENEAWAKRCEAMRDYPSPRLRRVTLIA